jgi:hypothetical protein
MSLKKTSKNTSLHTTFFKNIMTNASTDKFVLELMDDLVAHGIHAAQNGIIHSLAIWLDNHIQGEFMEKRKREVGTRFCEWVMNFVRQSHFQRKIWDESQSLPSHKNEWEASQKISGKILGQMNGMPFEQGLEFIAWIYAAGILSCPAFMIKNSPEYKGSISTGTETELINLMLRYLDIYMTM